MPAHVVVAVQPHFVAGRGNQAGDLRGRGPDQGRGQQSAVTHGLEAIDRRRPGAPHFLQKACLPKDAPDSAAGVIRPEGQEEAGLDRLLGQNPEQGRHPLTITLQSVYVYFDGQFAAHWLQSYQLSAVSFQPRNLTTVTKIRKIID